MNSEVERDIVLASHILDCHNIVIMPHTKCAMASLSLPEVRIRLNERSGMDFSSFEPRMIGDWEETLRADVARLKANKLLNEGAVVRGARYDVDTGMVHWVC
jgi:carbonic anhydrase